MSLISPVANLNLELVLTQQSESKSHIYIFPKDNKELATNNSFSGPTNSGVNTLIVPLSLKNLISKTHIKWKLCDCNDQLIVQSVSLTSIFGYSEIDLRYLDSGLGVKRTSQTPIGLQVYPNTLTQYQELYLTFNGLYFFIKTKLLSLILGGFIGSLIYALFFSSFPRIFLQMLLNNLKNQHNFSQIIKSKYVELFNYALILILIGNIFLIFQGSQRIGISVDEPTHVINTQRFLETGKYSSAVYGPATGLFLHLFSTLIGVENWGTLLFTEDAYYARHLGLAIISILGIISTFLITQNLFHSFWISFYSVIFLTSIPLWTGHSMFNIKDIPVATGFTLFTLGLVILLNSKLTFLFRVFFAILSIFLGIYLAIGTRPGIWPVFAFMIILLIFLILLYLKKLIKNNLYYFSVLFSLFSGLVITFNYFFNDNSTKNILASVRRSTSFPWYNSTLVNGVDVPAGSSRAYILNFLITQIPIYILILFLLGLFLSLKSIQHFSRNNEYVLKKLSIFFVLTQAFVIPFGIIIFNFNIYNGIRQILFILPPISIISAIGFVFLLRLVNSKKSLLISFLSISLIYILSLFLTQLRLFPFNYVFYNSSVSIKPIDNRWETDYWITSYREAITKMPALAPIFCSYENRGFLKIEDVGQPCDRFNIHNQRFSSLPNNSMNSRWYWSVRTKNSLTSIGTETQFCEVFDRVKRNLHGQDITMLVIYVCRESDI